jgi:hypothetical protein
MFKLLYILWLELIGLGNLKQMLLGSCLKRSPIIQFNEGYLFIRVVPSLLLFSIFVLTPFLSFFQYHKMLRKNEDSDSTGILILSNFRLNYIAIKLLGEQINAVS